MLNTCIKKLQDDILYITTLFINELREIYTNFDRSMYKIEQTTQHVIQIFEHTSFIFVTFAKNVMIDPNTFSAIVQFTTKLSQVKNFPIINDSYAQVRQIIYFINFLIK